MPLQEVMPTGAEVASATYAQAFKQPGQPPTGSMPTPDKSPAKILFPTTQQQTNDWQRNLLKFSVLKIAEDAKSHGGFTSPFTRFIYVINLLRK